MAVNPADGALYVSAPKIYARSVRGVYARLRVLTAVTLLGVFYLLPWLSWDGQPLLLFDLPARRFHVFGLTLVPQDMVLLTGLLIISALGLFLFTSLAGRLFCGYACPQTVWTESFMWIERLVEGDRHARMQRDKAPWVARNLWRKSLKHALWILLAAWTGISFVAYFVPIQTLLADLSRAELGGWPLFWSAFYGFATWGNAGFMREQVCRYMCPYARFQSAMFDRDTLIIAYHELRGEPRKSLARRTEQTAGDCIDCKLCVQVCPTGIDIRDGLQYECIACAACVDACDSVMDRIGKPRGLVRYSSANRDAGGRFHFLRPRVLGYGLVLTIVIGVWAAALFGRSDLQMVVIGDRQSLVRQLADGQRENIYTLRLTNKSGQARALRLEVVDAAGRPVRVQPDRFALGPSESARHSVSVRLQPIEPAASLGLRFQAYWEDAIDAQPAAHAEGRFVTGYLP
ncbi:MAG: cytochrome c oxidase accessory protein CcoG [Oceanococcaceae bacterium]